MIGYQFALYLGKEKEDLFFSYLVKESFIGILKIEGEFNKEEGKKFLEFVYHHLTGANNLFLERLDEGVNLAIKEINLPANFSATIGFLVDQVLYLKTINHGVVYIKRDNQIGKIISDDNEASGYIKKDDYFIFSFKELFEKAEEGQLVKLIAKKTPYEIVEELNPFLKETDDTGLAAFIVKFFEKNGQGKSFVLPVNFFKQKLTLINNLPRLSLQKKLGLLIVLVITFYLLINITQTLINSFTNNQIKKIKTTKELIISKLNEAEDTAFFNINQSRQLILEAKNQLVNLEKELGSQQPEEIAEIKKLIEEKENTIFKKEEKQKQEFYDLTIEEKNAQGERLYLDKENLLILDKKNGRLFNLDLVKKSISSFSNLKLKKAQLIALYDDKNFFLNQEEGIYQITDQKIKKVVEADKDWGQVVDFSIYGGNLYLLDKEKDEVYKYLIVSDGYSSKKSYFQPGEAVNLAGVNSMAIDGSVYLGFSDHVVKYLSGIRESFKISFPEEKISLKKIFTNRQLEKLFLWDKEKGAVYVFSKKGEYEREITSSIFSQGKDFVVFNQKIYVLLRSKIYTVDL